MKFPLAERFFFPLLLAASVKSAPPQPGAMKLPDLFSDHAVLQKRDQVPIWGEAVPGETVMVSVAGKLASARAGSDGRWKTTLDLAGASSGPFSLEVSGRDKVVVSDVLIGEVWVCSGQSNMDWSVARTVDAASAIAASANPQLRVFVPERQTSARPLTDLRGKWQVAGPGTTGGFPAVGYWFGKDLQEALHAPVGLVHISWGGSPVEAWTSGEALHRNPSLGAGSDRMIRVTEQFPAQLKEYQAKLGAWEEKYGRRGPPAADPQQYAAPEVATEDWRPVTLPGRLADQGLPDSGAIWLRRRFTITSGMTIGPLFINLGILADFDSLYLNGIKAGETTPDTAGGASPRTYYTEVGTVKPGEIVLALRLVAPAGGAAVTAPDFSIDAAPLNGTWLAKAEYVLPPLDARARAEYPAPMAAAPAESKTPAYLFNGMVNPVVHYGIRGAIWYQGEDNAPRARQYAAALPLMIRDWRRRWEQGDFPFYLCQLPKFGPLLPEPGDSAWAEMREAQTKTAAELPNVGQAVLIDLGEPGDIHPRDKTQVGARLARLALNRTYRQAIAATGPVYDGIKVEGRTVRIRFRETGGGLIARPMPATYQPMIVSPATRPLVLPSPHSAVQGFAISGADRRWVWADATIEGTEVVVSAPEVAQPVAVRYAWASSPVCNLFGDDGLPAAPFRTDDWPGLTQSVKYGFSP